MAHYGEGVFSDYDKPHAFSKQSLPAGRTVTEAQRETPVVREADVIVVGGGPGGVAAAVAAARGGARTILVERYGHLGGMATGGLVNIIPNLGDIYGQQHIGGFCQELLDRLAARGAADFPARQDWGGGSPALVAAYDQANMTHFYIRKNREGERVVLYTAVIDPEVGKDELNTMVLESGCQLLLHTWVTAPIVEGNRLRGVLVESKAGRQALMADVVIDSTGDGDLLPGTAEETVDFMEPGSRIAQLGFVYWICNVDLPAYDAFMAADPAAYQARCREITQAGGSPYFSRGLLQRQKGVVWVHKLIGATCQTDPEELTYIDVTTRRQSVHSWELLRDRMPGFANSFIMLSAPQLGTSGGRRLVGEYYLTAADMDRDQPFPDTIAVFADNDRGEASLRHPRTFVPYRALVPKGTEGLLVACRAFSADHAFSEFFNLIPHCMCFGQAAGTAAALAVRAGVDVRAVPYPALKAALLDQGVLLP